MVEDRPLDEIFEYESNKRSTASGIALAALGGDRKSIADFAGLAMVAVESSRSEVHADVLPWLLDILCQIHSGVEPNEAFGWKRKRSGTPSLSQDMEGLRKQWMVGQHMQGLVGEGCSARQAAKIVAKARKVSESEADRCYRRMSRNQLKIE